MLELDKLKLLPFLSRLFRLIVFLQPENPKKPSDETYQANATFSGLRLILMSLACANSTEIIGIHPAPENSGYSTGLNVEINNPLEHRQSSLLKL